MRVIIAGPASPQALADLMTDPSVPLPVGLGGTPVTALCRSLIDAGHEVTLVTLSPEVDGERIVEGNKLTVMCGPWRQRARDRALDFFSVERAAIRAHLRRAAGDVVHAHWTYEYALAALASPRPLVVTIHDSPLHVLRQHRDAYRSIRLLMAARFRAAQRRQLFLTAVSPHAAKAWQTTMLDPRPVHVVPNIGRSSSEVQRHPSPTVVIVANDSRLKNVSRAVTALSLLRRRFPAARMRLVGPGLGPSDPLAIRTASSGLGEGATFVGELSASATLAEIAAADVLLHPSLMESQGMCLIEAMLAGVPVVAGWHSGGAAWTVGDGAAGLLVDVANPAAMASAVARVLHDPLLAADLSARGRQLAAARYSGSAVTAEYLKVYAAAILS